MIKTNVAILVLLFLIGCSSQNKERIIKTGNPNAPFIYKTGIRNCSIVPVLSMQEKDSVFINELRFSGWNSAICTEQLMYDRFGKWTKALKTDGRKYPVLLWEKVKLFKNTDATYDIAACGIESYAGTYSSVIIFDIKNNDCLAEKGIAKDALIKYFSEGMKKLKEDRKFYDVYWEMFGGHETKIKLIRN